MKICFYVEPLIFHNKPFHYFAWLGYCTKIYNCLKTSSFRKEYEFRFITSEALAHYGMNNYGLPEDILIQIQQKEIKQDFNTNNTSITQSFQMESCGDEVLQEYGKIIQDKLSSFEPEIILTFSPVPFLERAYPNALILHMDNGMFSRTPYPDSLFFDPFGLYDQSFPVRFNKELKNYQASEEELDCLEKTRNYYKKHIDEKSPMPPYEEAIREHFDKIVLLPLQYTGETAFDIHCPFRNQGEYLYHVMENIPENVGVLTIEHPTALWVGDYFDSDTLPYLRERFPNFIMFEAFRKIQNISQLVVPYVDAVISISSSLGYQSLFWKKKLISLGTSHIDHFADIHSIHDFDKLDFNTTTNWDNAIAYLMTHYWITEQDCLNNENWLHNFFKMSLEKFEEGDLKFDFFDPLISPETITQKYVQGYLGNFPSNLHYFPANSGITAD